METLVVMVGLGEGLLEVVDAVLGRQWEPAAMLGFLGVDTVRPALLPQRSCGRGLSLGPLGGGHQLHASEKTCARTIVKVREGLRGLRDDGVRAYEDHTCIFTCT